MPKTKASDNDMRLDNVMQFLKLEIGELRAERDRLRETADAAAAAFVDMEAERDALREALSPFAARHTRLAREGQGGHGAVVLVPFFWLEQAAAALGEGETRPPV